jgi:hypothetical protein
MRSGYIGPSAEERRSESLPVYIIVHARRERPLYRPTSDTAMAWPRASTALAPQGDDCPYLYRRRRPSSCIPALGARRQPATSASRRLSGCPLEMVGQSVHEDLHLVEINTSVEPVLIAKTEADDTTILVPR